MKEKYINTPFNYTGSKFKQLEQLLPYFDYSKSCFVDAFSGGGSVWTNVIDKYEKIYANDIIEDLIKIQKDLIKQPITFANKVKELSIPTKNSQEKYNSLRESYNIDPTPDKLYALMLSCTNNMLRFNKEFKFNQTWGKRCFNESTLNKIREWVNHISDYDNITFLSRDFDRLLLNEVMNKDKEVESCDIAISNSMFYFDPPYGFIKTDKGFMGKKQISEAGYNAYWFPSKEERLYNMCHEIHNKNGSFCISGVISHNNKISWILDKLLSDGFNFHFINYDYEKVSRKESNKNTKEIIIFNYDVQTQKAI